MTWHLPQAEDLSLFNLKFKYILDAIHLQYCMV